MSTEIYDLDSSDDTDAWNAYHHIRSHRAPKQHPRRTRRISLVLAAVVAVGVLTPLAEGPSNHLPQAEASTSAQAVPREVESVSRSARAVSARTAKINRVIKFALAQRGDRYKWGATGPSKWDCSGLVMVAFKKGANRSLPHYTGGIQKRGVKVSKKNLKRGDIIFPQKGHVGIYLGNGLMVHASSGHGKVIVAKPYGFYTARRVL